VVKSVVKAILRKLGLRNRTQLAVSVHNAGRTAADPRRTGSRVAS
jgi:DNA-binding NarL/FixJ family response regulator